MLNPPEVTNVVASGSLGRELDVEAIAADIDAAEVTVGAEDYDPDVVYIRRRREGPLVTLYRSGSFHITGARSVTEAEGTLAWFRRQLSRLSVEALDISFAVQNVMAVGTLGRELNLNALWERFGYEYAEYDPEVHTALMYRPDQVDADFRIFSTGSVTIYVDSPAAVDGAFDWLRGEL